MGWADRVDVVDVGNPYKISENLKIRYFLEDIDIDRKILLYWIKRNRMGSVD
jgi:hypothetical protein